MGFCAKELSSWGLCASERGSKPPAGQTDEGRPCKQRQEEEAGSA